MTDETTLPLESLCYDSEITNEHPLRTKNYILPTEALEEFVNAAIQWLRDRVPGALIYGFSRLGKSCAIRYLCECFRTLTNRNMAILSATAGRYRGQTNMGQFCGYLLEDFGNPFAGEGQAWQKQQRVLQALHAQCIEDQSSTVALVVDDAQWLTETEYCWLADLHARLARRDLQLIVLLVGQDSLRLKPASIRGEAKWPVCGRFMQESFRFRGVENEQDLTRVLLEYDRAVFPPGSGITFTQAEVPAAWAGGFRLSHNAALIWGAMAEARLSRTDGIGTDVYPMQVVARGIEGLLRVLHKQDRADLTLSRELIKNAFLQFSGGLLAVQYKEK